MSIFSIEKTFADRREIGYAGRDEDFSFTSGGTATGHRHDGLTRGELCRGRRHGRHYRRGIRNGGHADRSTVLLRTVGVLLASHGGGISTGPAARRPIPARHCAGLCDGSSHLDGGAAACGEIDSDGGALLPDVCVGRADRWTVARLAAGFPSQARSAGIGKRGKE